MADSFGEPVPSNSVLSNILKWTCGICATAVVGYALYFDYCRTHAPDYKDQIRKKRKDASQAGSDQFMSIPDISNQAEVQQYFLQQVQLGEELIAQGIVDKGVQHLCNAVILCGQPEQLLSIFRQTMPNEFPMIMEEMPNAQARIETALKNKHGLSTTGSGDTEPSIAIVDDDDLE